MSKRGYISRYLLIIKRLKFKPYSTLEELQGYLDNQFEYLQLQDDTLNLGFSKRTLQRDIREIRNIFGVSIEYSKPNKGYYLIKNDTENMNFQRLLEAFDVYSSLNLTNSLTPFLFPEKSRPQGTENLFDLLHAIKNKLRIKFNYQKFWDVAPCNRDVAPYALKEFKNRWYLIANDEKSNVIKTYALDRLTNLEITKSAFSLPENYDVENHFKYCYGIISKNDTEPQEIILSFNSFQGNYIKTLPLHQTQKILIDSEDELQVSLNLYLTFDLIMELLSFGKDVKVLKPELLANEIKKVHQQAAELYS
jgi:predicted DNA-binding transcriptional regulator YafY